MDVYRCLCCELLSKIIIFVMKDKIGTTTIKVVVNCFQNYYFRDEGQTSSKNFPTVAPFVRIAFKKFYLRDEGQLCS